MDEVELRNWISREGNSQFSRSGGPGGQNVNKVNTKVTLKLPVSEMPLSTGERERLREKLSGRINTAGELVIHVTETRSQIRNRQLSEEKVYRLIADALKTHGFRIPTTVVAASTNGSLISTWPTLSVAML